MEIIIEEEMVEFWARNEFYGETHLSNVCGEVLKSPKIVE